MRPPYAKLRQTRSESDDECAIKHEESSPVVASVGRTERLIWFCVVLTLLIKIVLLEISHAVTPSRSFSYEMGFATDLVAAAPHISLHEVVFTGGVERDADGKLFLNHSGEIRRYVGEPSREIDDNWKNIENAIDIILNRSETRTYDGHDIKTMREPGKNGNYRLSIDVIHSLHCVNQLRKAVYSDHYFPQTKQSHFCFIHMSHCVEHLRQAIQCHSDLTPLVYTWDEEEARGSPVWTSRHTCRDFEQLLEWDHTRAARGLDRKIDVSVNGHR